MRTCEISFAALDILFLCCVNVVNQNAVALLLLVFCYSYATWHVLVTHLTTYTQHEKREAKEKRQDRRILQNRTYGYRVKDGMVWNNDKGLDTSHAVLSICCILGLVNNEGQHHGILNDLAFVFNQGQRHGRINGYSSIFILPSEWRHMFSGGWSQKKI